MSIKITGDVLQSGTTTVATLSTTSFALANTAALTASNGLAVTGSSEFNDEVVIRGDLTVLGTQTLGDVDADSLAVTGHATFNGEITASLGVLVKDDMGLYFGDGKDASFEYDEDDTDTLLYAGASMRFSDDTKLEFGTGGDASFEYDEDGNDVLVYDGTSMRFDTATKLEFGDAGTFVHQSADGVLTLTSDTTVDINGAVVMDGALTGLTSINVDGTITGDTSLTIDAVTLTDTELGYLDGLTLGTAAASKVMTWAADSSWTAAGGTCANLGTVSAATSITTTDLIGTNIDGIIGGDTARAGTFAALTASSAHCSGDMSVAGVFSGSNGFKVTDGAASNASMALDDTNGFALTVASAQISANTVISGTLNNTGNVTLGGTLEVEGTTHLNGNVTADNNVDVTGDLTAASITCAGFVVDADGDTNLKSLRVDDNSYVGCDSVTDLIQLQADGDIIVKDGTYDFDIASHDGTNGLLLGGVTVTAAAAELNYNDITTLGTAQASKAMTWAANSSWTAAGGTCANLGTVSAATSITTTDLIGTNIDGIIGADTARAGSFAAVTATSLNCGEGNITNVGSIACDSIVHDVVTGLALDGSGVTTSGGFTAMLPDNLAIGFQIMQGTGSYMSFCTSNGAEQINVYRDLIVASTNDAKARSFITYSDATLKQDIKPLDSALDKVMSMRGVSYEFKNQATADGGTHREVGFLAQEMKQTVPEVVYGSGDGNLGIDYAKLTSVLVEAIKSQQGQIEELRASLLKK